MAQYAPNRDNGQSTFPQNTVEKIVKESTPKQDFVKAMNAKVNKMIILKINWFFATSYI